MIKKIITTLCLLFSILIVYSGNPDVPKNDESKDNNPGNAYSASTLNNNLIYPVWGFFIEGSSGLSTITNSNLSSEIWDTKNNLGYTFNAGYFHSFGSSFRIKAGFGFSSYSTSLTGNGEIRSQQLKDIDNDSYSEILILENTQHNSNPMYLSLPVLFQFGNLNISKTGFYIDFGFKYSYLVNEMIENKGTYTSKGYYEQWGVTVEDVPELGFYTSENTNSSTGFSKSNYSLLGGAGITIPLSGVVILKLGLTASMGLKDIGNNQAVQPETSPLTQDAFLFRSEYIDNPLAVKKGSKTGYLGFEIGLYINKLVK